MPAVDSREHLNLTLLGAEDQEGKADAGAALYRFNVENTGVADRRPVGAKLADPDSGKIIGGLWGRTELGLLFLDMFFLPESVRGQSQGSRLLLAV